MMRRPAFHTKRGIDVSLSRLAALVAASVVGMTFIFMTAYVVAMRGGALSYPVGLMLAAVVGVTCGLTSAPFVVGWLLDADLKKALPRVYAVALAVTLLSMWPIPEFAMFSAPVAAFVAVVVMAYWCGWQFSEQSVAVHRRLCPNCEYQLNERYDEGCPECGWGRGKDATMADE